MKIPRRFISQGIWWTVRYTNDIGNSGETDYDKQEILIRKSLSPEMKEMVFFHEIGHTLNTTMSHEFMDSFTLQYFQVLKENKLL